ncbi:MAG: hypothetical protein ACJ719_05805 [Nitrososphaeraceae archaeon]
MNMYAKICGLELLSSYITELGVGDILSLQALVKNPLDWHHFYEKISLIKKGGKTDFTVVTREGDRLVGSGIVQEIEKWSNNGKFGFKIKVNITKQKSLADRRIKLQNMPRKYQNSTARKPTPTQLAPLTTDAVKQPNIDNNSVVPQVPKL